MTNRRNQPLSRLAALCLALIAVLVLLARPALAEPTSIRVGVLEFGTANWELDTIRHHGLDRDNGVELEVVRLAGRDATTVALHGRDVDMIVIDWIWVSRERAAGEDFTFMPFSKAVGALVVPAESDVETLADLNGRRLGVAGGPLDKSWLLMRALARQDHGFDLAAGVDAVFGAPPLLNEQLAMGRLDGVITYWHFVAHLEAAGMRRVLDVEEAARRLGIDRPVPLLGFVFREDWAAANRDAVLGLLAASREAKALLRDSDAAWERLRPRMRAGDDATFAALKDGYREGIPDRWGDGERAAAAEVFAILAELGGAELVGAAKDLQPGTFWDPARY